MLEKKGESFLTTQKELHDENTQAVFISVGHGTSRLLLGGISPVWWFYLLGQ